MNRDPKAQAWLREKGVELEGAIREAGSTLPPGVSGHDLLTWMLDQAEAHAKSPEGQAISKQTMQVVAELIAELPGGVDHPDFLKRLKARQSEILGVDDSGGASA